MIAILLWTVAVAGSGTYLAGQAVPLWFKIHGEQLLIVTSGSMEPTFAAGDAVVLKTITNPADLRVGQVVTFWPVTGTSLVTHRITAMKLLPPQRPGDTQKATGGSGDLRPYIMTKGDANRAEDPNATPVSQVRGIVLSSHPKWGRWMAWANSARGRLALLGPSITALIALEVSVTAASWQRRSRVSRARSRVEVQVDRWSVEMLND